MGELSGGVRYDGAAPMCGKMGDVAQFDFLGNFGFGAAAIAAEVNPLVKQQFPAPLDYPTTTLPLILETLFEEYPHCPYQSGRVVEGFDAPAIWW